MSYITGSDLSLHVHSKDIMLIVVGVLDYDDDIRKKGTDKGNSKI